MLEIKEFIQKVGDKHFLIHKLCQEKFLATLGQVSKNIVSCEEKLVENHFNSITNLKNLERKYRQQKITLKELNQELYKAT